MAQNTSHAVMQQRHETHDSLDDFPTPPWSVRAVIEKIVGPYLGLENLRDHIAWEPCANRGYMARPLAEYIGSVVATDIHDYGAGYPTCDFLIPGLEPEEIQEWGVDTIFMNPPFRLAEQFIERAFEVGARNVVAIVRTSFLEGGGRYERLWKLRPPTVVAQHVERVPMVKGRYDPKASTATSYAWVAWLDKIPPQPFAWIPPCRKQLEKPSDYEGRS